MTVTRAVGHAMHVVVIFAAVVFLLVFLLPLTPLIVAYYWLRDAWNESEANPPTWWPR